MFGKNPIRGRETDPNSLAITSIFYTIQGEGPFSGCPALFIRLAGCNLACAFCDTEFEEGMDRPLNLAELAAKLGRFPEAQRRLVVITGGEPLRQNIAALCDLLLASGTEHIQIETAGTLWVPMLETFIQREKLTLVCSPKTPRVHEMVLEWCHDWKYVIRASDGQGEDGLPITGTQVATIGKPSVLARPRCEHSTIWLSPCDEYDEALNARNLTLVRDLCLKHGYRVNLQIHKILSVA